MVRRPADRRGAPSAVRPATHPLAALSPAQRARLLRRMGELAALEWQMKQPGTLAGAG